ncbi:putative response regulator receiver (CheY-like protein) [Bradyrhizobium sp. ORS 375]|uniref:response regulator n=1 Tax=Bradyrhizobium sp. (strain ORS 375) TaxID=566679 RepID=UPI000240630A|nr:response regulator [Bradyrhizobium sp. ORS 375]CCD91854.1 putative response regulator receiver (CheY-like protein) [Bradyrhizobium sp. ORS 375]
MHHGSAIPRTSSQPFAGRSILIVEDEYFLADDLADEFRRRGAEVIGPMCDIDEAQALLRSGQSFDAALLDINVRSEMIFPVARILRERNIPFVFTTGYDKASIRPEFADVPHWEKPIDISSVADFLAARLREH